MEDTIRRMLEVGTPRVEIAAHLGVSPSTITRYARLLGFPDARTRKSLTDWTAVQDHYDQGHSIDECRDRFGFSYGAWDKAVMRGDLVSRPRSEKQLARKTRDAVEQLIAEGLTQAEVGRELGLSKSTVAYHMRKLGRRGDPRFALRYDWSEVQRAIDEEGLPMGKCLERFGFCAETWRDAIARGAITPRPHVMELEELLVVGRRTSRGHLKSRLIQAGLKENRCEECGIREWCGESLSMNLHHLNGDGTDNRIENLQFLCPNCHSQTENFSGRGVRRRRHLKLVEPPLEDEEAV